MQTCDEPPGIKRVQQIDETRRAGKNLRRPPYETQAGQLAVSKTEPQGAQRRTTCLSLFGNLMLPHLPTVVTSKLAQQNKADSSVAGMGGGNDNCSASTSC